VKGAQASHDSTPATTTPFAATKALISGLVGPQQAMCNSPCLLICYNKALKATASIGNSLISHHKARVTELQIQLLPAD